MNAASVPTLGEWPKDGLEAVRACPVCGAKDKTLLYAQLTDRVFFCAPGEWSLYRCESCRAAHLDPRPTAASIGLAYNRYYTHGVTGGSREAPRTIVGRLKSGLRRGYLESKFDTRSTRRISLGSILVPLLVRQRLGLDRWARHLPAAQPGHRLLDIGCGNGRFLQVAKSLGWDACGLDPDRNAIEAARQGGHEVTLGSLPQTGFAESSFDIVTLSHMLEHASDPNACLREVYRILKPGGTLWLSTPNLDGFSRLRFAHHWLALDPPRHLVLFTRESLADACSRAGFSEITPLRTLLSDYVTSLALARGRDPWEHLDLETGVAHGKARLSPAQHLEALFATLAPLAMPGMSDEIIMIAVKPSNPTHDVPPPATPVKNWLKRAAIRLTANESAQILLERAVRRLNFLMGVGAGSYVESSGELALADKLEAYRAPDRPLCVFDVGANRGQFATMLQARLRGAFAMHCFEPARETFAQLCESLGEDRRFVLNNFALGSRAGTTRLHYDKAGSGLASVYKRRLDHQRGLEFTQSEEIPIRTLDDYCAEHRIERIDLLKVDVEGHELDVLNGAARTLSERKIKMVSFEFGGCNIDSRTYFQDFHQLFSKLPGTRMYRITPSGFVMPLSGYREDREQFGVTNYLVVFD